MLKPIRCAVYTRKSSDEGLEQSFNSLHAQREACEAYIVSQKHEGWELVPTHYDDGGFSGGTMERPGLKALLADVEAGLVDSIVVYKVDRLSRRIIDFLKMIERFDEKGISFVSVTQAFNTTTSMGRLMLNVLLSFAQFEREVTGERIRDKIAASKAKGMWMGGMVPLGYRIQDRALKVHKAEAEQVRTLFDLYRKLKSVDATVEQAWALGIGSKLRRNSEGKVVCGGTKLARGSLYAILANKLYIGKVEHKGSVYPGLHEAIVADDLFEAVQRILESQRRKRRGSLNGRAAPLSSLVFGADGHPLRSTHTKKDNRRYRYYAGGELRLPAQDLEELVVDRLVAAFGDPASLGLLWGDLSLLTPAVVSQGSALAKKVSKASGIELRKLLLGLIERVTVSPTQIVIKISLEAFGLATVGTLSIPTTIGRNRAQLSLVVPGPVAPKPDPALIAMVAQARVWFDRLTSGEAHSLAQIAEAENISPAYVRQMLPAAFLAPDIVARIVEGRQPASLTVSKLKDMLPLPNAWPEQRAAFAAIA